MSMLFICFLSRGVSLPSLSYFWWRRLCRRPLSPTSSTSLTSSVDPKFESSVRSLNKILLETTSTNMSKIMDKRFAIHYLPTTQNTLPGICHYATEKSIYNMYFLAGLCSTQIFRLTRLWLIWQSRWLNSDSTQHFTFLDWLNSDSTQITNFLTWLNFDSAHLSQSWFKSDSRLITF